MSTTFRSGNVICLSLFAILVTSDRSAAATGDQTTASAEERATQAVSDLLSHGKSRGTFPTPDELYPPLKAWYESSIKPALKAAENSLDDSWKCAVDEFRRWDSLVARSGARDKFVKERDASSISEGKAYKFAFDLASARCVNENDPFQVGIILQLSKEAAVRSVPGEEGDYRLFFGNMSELDAAVDKIQRCASFEVTIESAIDDTYDVSECTRHLQAMTSYFGAAPVRYTPGPPPRISSRDRGSRAEATGVQYNIKTCDAFPIDRDNAPSFRVHDLVIANLFDKRVTCGGVPTPPVFGVRLCYGADSGNLWQLDYLNIRDSNKDDGDSTDLPGTLAGPEGTNEDFVYCTANFTQGGGETFAEKVLKKSWDSKVGVVFKENTTITIKHTPR
jgi:hypothetical protein